jgi:hypothetical protein
VSLWFPERITLHVSADCSLAAVPAGETLRQHGIELAASRFERNLDDASLPRRSRVTCVLAGELVRYCIVPWNPSAMSTNARRAFAAHCFREVYGASSSGWTVRLDEPRYGEPTLACAIDSALLDRLAALLHSRRLVLESITPSLVQASRAARSELTGSTFWCVVQESRAMTLLLVEQQRPLLVKVLSAREHDLGRVLAREWLALGLEAARCASVVVSPELGAAQALRGWKVRVLGAQSPQHDAVHLAPASGATPVSAAPQRRGLRAA